MARGGEYIALTVLALLAAVADATAQDRPPRDHALVIGLDISASPIQGVPRLSYAVKDAKAVADLFEQANYEVVELIDDIARRENVVSELQRLAFTTQPHDSVLIYFAGHGVRQKVGNGEYSYWLTYDATLSQLEVNGIRLTHLLDYVNDIPAKRKVLILDHCHSGDVDVSDAALDGARDTRGVLSVSSQNLFSHDDFRAQVESAVADGLLVLGAATDKAYEFPELQHGILTYVLIKAMTTPDADTDGNDKLSLTELKSFVIPKITELAEEKQVVQTPISVERGTNLNWDVVALSTAASLEELEPLLGNLGAWGDPDNQYTRYTMRCYEAIDNVRHGINNPTDDQIISYLQGIHGMSPGQWPRKIRMLKDYIDALTGVQ